ncbi:arogenate dehydratase/prephenate dehydratase 1, chloroplastic isoform X2 [Amborella trichopoda]|uniref:arogenate dehydratase/prephenate dehydratase 1, chloroplastic isoform X2 n=1 Tax=Amborella trichopoda TaxID=13333 RepID=UPI0009BDAEE1|nr:arogenate dehydratase/prephenate dehydratase 1, chloroplastic isoform X2 [Amborella trichopoda]|eukprot:XP_020530085.1 arogenate dehydratase/prephenate dehydratase 1, chloroplastic isoform X2 [Amborella trichopoda]
MALNAFYNSWQLPPLLLNDQKLDLEAKALTLSFKPKENNGSSTSPNVNDPQTPLPPVELKPLLPNPPIELRKEFISLPRPLSVTDLAACPSHGAPVRVAYQGVPGAYSEEAALKAYPQCEAVPCDQFEAAFKAVELWLVDKAVLPIENSLGGSIHRNYDLLLRHRLHIVGEVQILVNHCLLGLPGVRREELTRVLSHPQALAQCEIALSQLGVVRESVDNIAGAAQLVATQRLRDTGAIASARAAELYGLIILAERIQDDFENVTRFLILAREPIIPRGDQPFKTSIVFTLEEGPGVLFKALAVFALREINLTKIESRPQRKRPLRVVDDSNNGSAKYFDYLFYIDFEASMADPRAQNALGHLQVHVRKILFTHMHGALPAIIVTLLICWQSECKSGSCIIVSHKTWLMSLSHGLKSFAENPCVLGSICHCWVVS